MRVSILSIAALAALATAAVLPPRQPPEAPSTSATSGKITWFNPDLGACGQRHGDNDMVVALSSLYFDRFTPNGNPNKNTLCGKRIRVEHAGKQVDVTIGDRCVGCAYGDVDLSIGAFKKIADVNAGRVQGTWDFIN